jgi:hypothetical protein
MAEQERSVDWEAAYRTLQAAYDAQRQQLAQALATIARQAERIAQLEARLAKDSHNSGKPPASDGLGRRRRRAPREREALGGPARTCGPHPRAERGARRGGRAPARDLCAVPGLAGQSVRDGGGAAASARVAAPAPRGHRTPSGAGTLPGLWGAHARRLPGGGRGPGPVRAAGGPSRRQPRISSMRCWGSRSGCWPF